MSNDPFRNYDAWLVAPMERMIEESDAEWDAYVEWLNEQGIIATDDMDPHKDADWQAHCSEMKRLEAESWAAYEEANPPCSHCDWVGTHDIDCPEAGTMEPEEEGQEAGTAEPKEEGN